MRRGTYLGFLAPVLLSIACSGPATVSAVSDDIVRNSEEYRSVVAFDLRNDARPSCTLFLHEIDSQGSAPAQRSVLLPFPTENAGNTRGLFTTWATMNECCSLVSYIQRPGKPGTFSLAMKPVFAIQPQGEPDLPGQIYFLRLGQERRFIYTYSLPKGNDDIVDLLSVPGVGMPDAVAVARPANAKGLEVKGGVVSGMTESVPRKKSNGVAAFYAGTASEAGTNRLEVRYELPLNAAQQSAFKLLVELLGALAIPLGILSFRDSKHTSRRSGGLRVFLLFIFVEFVVLSAVGYMAWEDKATKSTEAVLSSLVVLAGLVASIAASSKSLHSSATEA